MAKNTIKRIKTFFKRWRYWIVQFSSYIFLLERDNLSNFILSKFGDTYGVKMINYFLSLIPKDANGWGLLLLGVSVIIIIAYDPVLYFINKQLATSNDTIPMEIGLWETKRCSHCDFGYRVNIKDKKIASLAGATTTCPECGNTEKVPYSVWDE